MRARYPRLWAAFCPIWSRRIHFLRYPTTSMVILSYGGSSWPRADATNTSFNTSARSIERISSRNVIPGAVGSIGVRRYTNARAYVILLVALRPIPWTMDLTFSAGVCFASDTPECTPIIASTMGFHISSSFFVNVLYKAFILSRNLSWRDDACNCTF